MEGYRPQASDEQGKNPDMAAGENDRVPGVEFGKVCPVWAAREMVTDRALGLNFRLGNNYGDGARGDPDGSPLAD